MISRLQRPCLWRASSSTTSMDSSVAADKKPQVLTRMVSASAASATSFRPWRLARPAMRSVSTRFFGQPRATM